MVALLEFSTDSVDLTDRLDAWGDMVWGRVGGLETETFEDEPFEGYVRAGELGQALVCNISVGRHRVNRTNRLIRRSDPELIKLVFQVGGEVCVDQRDQRLVLRPGQWCVYDSSQPYSVSNTAPAEQLAILIPRQALSARGVEIGPYLLRPFSAETGVSRILGQCLRSTLRELDTLGEAARNDLVEPLMDLVRLSISAASGERQSGSGRQIMLERVKTYVRKNIADPGLSIDAAATAFGCSKRYLHKVFRDHETTLNEFIWDLRLARCAQDLASPRMAGCSITEISFGWGFVNSTHFSRAFRERFGVSPRTYRALSTAPMNDSRPGPRSSVFAGSAISVRGRTSAAQPALAD